MSAIAAAALATTGIAVATTIAATPAAAESNAEGAPIYSDNTFYAYAQAGETLDVSFTKVVDQATGTATKDFAVIRPDGSTAWTCTVEAGAAVGTECAVEDLAVDQTGAWKITSVTRFGATTFDWNITVNAGGTAQAGRVWSNLYSVLQDDGIPRDLTYYMVNDSGYQYTTTLRSYNGIGSTIRANSLGLADAETCVPSYESRDSDNLGDVTQTECGDNFRIFFQPPSAALPETTPSADGTLTVLPDPLTDEDLAVDDLAFAPAAANGAAGTFTYSLTPRFEGAHQLQIDTNGNGSYDDAVDRIVDLGADGSGAYTYAFDGLDGNGAAIADCTLMNARIFYDSVGEMHVLQSDVERRAGGIQITRTNGPGAPNSTIYWDDRAIDPGQHQNATPVLDGTAGVNSVGGVHGWEQDGDSWGNSALIDDWTFRPLDLGTGEIAIGGLCYEVTKTADTEVFEPGNTVTYTIAIENTGDLDYTPEEPATFTDDLSAVIDDATYNDDATGGATYDEPVLSWSGPLAVGETVEVTYTVTINDPLTGDQELANTVVGGVNCPPGSTDPECNVTIPGRGYTVEKTSSEAVAAPGDTVTYTVTVTHIGDAPFTDAEPASIEDDLSEVLDDATYNDDATSGATVTGDTLTWSGPLAVDEVVTITYSVTIDDPITGDGILTNVVDPGIGSCVTDCTTDTPVRSYEVSKSSDPSGMVAVGQTVTYTVTVTNTGAGDYTVEEPVSIEDDLSGVLDDAAYNGDASNGAVVNGDTLTWSGPLAVGESTTITYSVTVGAVGEGDDELANVVTPTGPGGECLPDECTTTNIVGALEAAKTVDVQDAEPGDTVTYTLTLRNIGAADYTEDEPATLTDDLSDVLDDATYNDDASSGATYSAPVLSWEGPLAAGDSVTITYSLTVKAAGQGDGELLNTVVVPGSNCFDGSGDDVCAVSSTVPGDGLAVTGASAWTGAAGIAALLAILGWAVALMRRRTASQ